MKTAGRLDRMEATIESLALTGGARMERIEISLDQLSQAANAIAGSVAAHEGRIERLVRVEEIQQQRWEQLQREWQAYLTTIHPRQ